MSDKNTTPILDGDSETREDIKQSESELLKGLLEAGSFKDGNSTQIEIRRQGKLMFSFRIRPLSEDEVQECYKNATKFAKPKHYGAPKTAIETDRARLRSLMIYTATVNEDRAKVWDNKKALDAFNLLTGSELIDRVLLAGEKDLVCDRIDEISGFNSDLEEQAKN